VGRTLILLAAIGACLGATLCLVDLARTKDTLGGLVTAKEGRWEADVVLGDLPDEPAASGGSHDGGFFYVIARDPFDYDQMRTSLDFPRYRVQRIFYPAVTWLAHPTGGGPGLVWTMFAVNVVGLFIGGLATGRLSTLLGGPVWPAVIFGPMFGSIVSLRLSVSDALVLALTIAAIVLSLQSRHRWAIVLAVAAVLTKESTFIILVGFAIWRRDRHAVAFLAVPAAVAGAWWLWLAVRLPGPLSPEAYRPPLFGWKDAIEFWQAGYEPLGLVSAVTGIGLAVAALIKTRPQHPLWWPLALLFVASLPLSVHVLGPERNASRIFLPMQILGIVALVTTSYRRPTSAPSAAEDTDCGDPLDGRRDRPRTDAANDASVAGELPRPC
jgi:hypothetical protein